MSKPTSAPPHTVDLHVGARLKELRNAAGVSQVRLAETLHITFQQVQKYEKGVNRISASKLYAAAQLLGVGIQDFFDGVSQSQDQHVEESQSPVAETL